ncbi:Pirin [Burkholderiales bacterium 8X]|nr:Pirin [Burkholderiales bacterium 8X]
MQTIATRTRRIAYRTRGHGHGGITRLMSPSDLGESLKPFVFLDIFNMERPLLDAMRAGAGMSIHPHSGIATVTVLTEGQMKFDDPSSGTGTLSYGGLEWLRAGGGVWHGKELTPDNVPLVQGFQLWIALPPELENGEPESRYIEPQDVPSAGPARIILGEHAGVHSPTPAPVGINYLLVTLEAGQSWTYQPPAGHTVGWLAVARGTLQAGAAVRAGDMVVFEASEDAITVQAGMDGDAVFVLASAIPHPYELHLGSYSVHTSEQALEAGERRIETLRQQMVAAGNRRTPTGNVPVFR